MECHWSVVGVSSKCSWSVIGVLLECHWNVIRVLLDTSVTLCDTSVVGVSLSVESQGVA